jgi:hypothetical protein
MANAYLHELSNSRSSLQRRPGIGSVFRALSTPPGVPHRTAAYRGCAHVKNGVPFGRPTGVNSCVENDLTLATAQRLSRPSKLPLAPTRPPLPASWCGHTRSRPAEMASEQRGRSLVLTADRLTTRPPAAAPARNSIPRPPTTTHSPPARAARRRSAPATR